MPIEWKKTILVSMYYKKSIWGRVILTFNFNNEWQVDMHLKCQNIHLL